MILFGDTGDVPFDTLIYQPLRWLVELENNVDESIPDEQLCSCNSVRLTTVFCQESGNIRTITVHSAQCIPDMIQACADNNKLDANITFDWWNRVNSSMEFGRGWTFSLIYGEDFMHPGPVEAHKRSM